LPIGFGQVTQAAFGNRGYSPYRRIPIDEARKVSHDASGREMEFGNAIGNT
jgi:hypothetical protein